MAKSKNYRITMDMGRRMAWKDGKELELRSKEFDLLKALVEANGYLISRKALTKLIWGRFHKVESRTLDQHISRLRSQIGHDCIETVTNHGYKLMLEGAIV